MIVAFQEIVISDVGEDLGEANSIMLKCYYMKYYEVKYIIVLNCKFRGLTGF